MLTAIGFIIVGALCLAILGATLFVFGMFFTLVVEGFASILKPRGGERNANTQ